MHFNRAVELRVGPCGRQCDTGARGGRHKMMVVELLLALFPSLPLVITSSSSESPRRCHIIGEALPDPRQGQVFVGRVGTKRALRPEFG